MFTNLCEKHSENSVLNGENIGCLHSVHLFSLYLYSLLLSFYHFLRGKKRRRRKEKANINCPGNKNFENAVVKGENIGRSNLHSFPTIFSTLTISLTTFTLKTM